MPKKGYLILENGRIFEGQSFGYEKETCGEVVFNTGMMGYPESLTDPSYFGQILTMTYPLVGNYGVPEALYWESGNIHVRGLIVSTYHDNNSHWQSRQTLGDWLKSEKVLALSDIDTRTLTKTIREKGVLKGIITFSDPPQRRINFYDINQDNLVSKVSCKDVIKYGSGKIKILLIDCGLKLNQIRLFQKLDITIIRVPWDFDPFKNNLDFDAVLISNGPGDPKLAKETIGVVSQIIERRKPILGICLGNQILALAAGADTYKLKYGHRSQNQPVKDELTGRCYITTQNHGFAVDTKTLPEGWKAWFTNLNDQTNEGIRHEGLPFYSTQFHPEAAAGPTDTEWIFEYFITRVKEIM